MTMQGLDQKDASILMGKVLLGLKYIHEQGLIHRDIKSDNIYLAENQLPRIGDFGFSGLS